MSCQVEFSRYEGKALLVVNVASECGFTDGHYRALKRMHDILRFNNKFEILGGDILTGLTPRSVHFVILAFPCNQFGGQEPGQAEEIRDVAFNQYGVKFHLFQKVDVHGANSSPVWRYLTGGLTSTLIQLF